MSLPKRPYSKRGERKDHIDHPLYRTWHNMMRRCYCKYDKGYCNYGERGIKVDERWWQFNNFLVDMGGKPSKHHTLDRIDNEIGYCKSNCRWATRSEQCDNRRQFKNNTSGARGVQKHNYGYSARYDYEGVRYNLGRFVTFEEALLARNSFVELFHKDRTTAIVSISKETVWNNSQTKIRGVTSHADGGFVVRVTLAGVRHYVGYYKDLEEAKDARLRFVAERTDSVKERTV